MGVGAVKGLNMDEDELVVGFAVGEISQVTVQPMAPDREANAASEHALHPPTDVVRMGPEGI